MKPIQAKPRPGLAALHYSIANDRRCREIRHSQKYGELYMVAYALVVANSIDFLKSLLHLRKQSIVAIHTDG